GAISGHGGSALQRRSDRPGQPLSHQPGPRIRPGCRQSATPGEPAADAVAGECFQGSSLVSAADTPAAARRSPTLARYPAKLQLSGAAQTVRHHLWHVGGVHRGLTGRPAARPHTVAVSKATTEIAPCPALTAAYKKSL